MCERAEKELMNYRILVQKAVQWFQGWNSETAIIRTRLNMMEIVGFSKVVHQRTSTTSTEVRCRTSVGFRADRSRPQSAHIRSKTSLSITRSVTDHYEV